MRQHTLTPGFRLSFRSFDLGDLTEDDEEDMDEVLLTHSPEPPEPVEPDDTMQTDANSQLGRLHPEQDLSHIFKVGASQMVRNASCYRRTSCFDSLRTLFGLMMEFNFYSNVIVAPPNNGLFSNICLTLLKKTSPFITL